MDVARSARKKSIVSPRGGCKEAGVDADGNTGHMVTSARLETGVKRTQAFDRPGCAEASEVTEHELLYTVTYFGLDGVLLL